MAGVQVLRKRGLSLATLLLLTAGPAQAAAEGRTAADSGISDAELEQRLAFIDARLERLQPAAKTWQYGWTGFYSLSSAGQAIAALESNDKDDQLNYAVGAVKAAGGLAQVLLKPLPTLHSNDRFRALPADNREQRLQKLARGEALLETSAQRAGERFTWRRHAMGIAGNLVGGIVIAAFGDQGDALVSTLVGLAVAEATIWTEPAAAARDLEDYRSGRWSRRAARPGQWRVLASPGGATLQISF
jgi:hypothetical protein